MIFIKSINRRTLIRKEIFSLTFVLDQILLQSVKLDFKKEKKNCFCKECQAKNITYNEYEFYLLGMDSIFRMVNHSC